MQILRLLLLHLATSINLCDNVIIKHSFMRVFFRVNNQILPTLLIVGKTSMLLTSITLRSISQIKASPKLVISM